MIHHRHSSSVGSDQLPVERLLSKKELAHFLGVSVGTVNRWVSNGTAPKYYRLSLHLRFPMSGVMEFLERRAVESGERVAA